MPPLVNLSSLIDDARCYTLVRQHRWPEGVRCPRCDSAAVARDGRDDSQPHRQRYHCTACGSRFDDLTGTILAGPARHEEIILYAEVDLATGRACYLGAGHMPPLLLPSDGEPTLLWDGRSTPLGVVLPGVPRPQAELVLRPGDAVLFYTDGLIESRRRRLDDGLALLEQAVRDAEGTLAEIADRLLVQLPASRGDDIALLGLRRS